MFGFLILIFGLLFESIFSSFFSCHLSILCSAFRSRSKTCKETRPVEIGGNYEIIIPFFIGIYNYIHEKNVQFPYWFQNFMWLPALYSIDHFT